MEIAQSVQSPLILSVETSGRNGSVAIAKGRQLLEEFNFSAPLRHSAELFDATQKLLDQHGYAASKIEHMYVTSGPGSFTGIRISVTMAKVLAFANSAKIVTLDTLDVLAQNLADKDNNGISKLAIILDAKRGQFFVAIYHRKGQRWEKTTDDTIMTSAEFVSLYSAKEPIWILGEGLVFYENAFKAENISVADQKYWTPHASKVHVLGWEKACKGEFADPMELLPHYLRGPDVSEKKR